MMAASYHEAAVQIIPRHLSRILERTISTSRIVNVVGPRQDGKSTLVRDLMKSAAYVTLDDTTSLRALKEDPYSQLKALSRQAPMGLPVVIDEIQRLPGLAQLAQLGVGFCDFGFGGVNWINQLGSVFG